MREGRPVPSRSGLILGLAIMAVSAYAAISAWSWPLKTALFPLVISIPLFILAAIEVLTLWAAGARFVAAAHVETAPGDVPESAARLRSLGAAGWILGFFAAILLFGFLVAIPVFVFLYLKLQSRESWLFSIIFTAVVWAAFWGLFDYTLHLPFASGWLF